MQALKIIRVLGAGLAMAAFVSGVARAEDDAPLLTGRSVASSNETCDRVTPVCAAVGGRRLVPYANECQARADGATSISFSGCFDEN